MPAVPLASDHMACDLIRLSLEIEINHAMNILLKDRISGAPVVDATGHWSVCCPIRTA